jgi:hypothetical protein
VQSVTGCRWRNRSEELSTRQNRAAVGGRDSVDSPLETQERRAVARRFINEMATERRQLGCRGAVTESCPLLVGQRSDEE